MIEVKVYRGPDEVVDQHVLTQWKKAIPIEERATFPIEVRQFIDAISEKMADFGRIGESTTSISGAELLLANMKEINGQPVYPWYFYPLTVPHMVAVDHKNWMYRAYRRRGKQGLIDYCKAQVKATDLERVLEILNVNVFKEDRAEFKQVLEQINASKKIDNPLQ